MRLVRRAGAAAALAVLAACATKGQVDRLIVDLTTLRIETARRDSARAAALAQVISLNQRIMDSLAAGRQAIRLVETRLSTDMTEIARQLLMVQELTGQSQARLSQLKAQLDARAEQAAAAGPPVPMSAADSARGAGATPVAPTVSADQMYQAARQMQLRGSLSTARQAYRDFLRAYPGHDLVPNAVLYIGDTFATEAPDSAAAHYDQVITQAPRSAQAPTALYKLALLEERRGKTADARRHYERLLRDYPRADEADLARDRLANLRP